MTVNEVHKNIGETLDKFIAKHGSEKLLSVLRCYVEVDNNDRLQRVCDYVHIKICSHYKIAENNLLNSNEFEYAKYRQIIWYLLNKHDICGINKLANIYNKNKSTISRAVAYIESIRESKRLNFDMNNDISIIEGYLNEFTATTNELKN